jgi:hypothetical protein
MPQDAFAQCLRATVKQLEGKLHVPGFAVHPVWCLDADSMRRGVSLLQEFHEQPLEIIPRQRRWFVSAVLEDQFAPSDRVMVFQNELASLSDGDKQLLTYEREALSRYFKSPLVFFEQLENRTRVKKDFEKVLAIQREDNYLPVRPNPFLEYESPDALWAQVRDEGSATFARGASLGELVKREDKDVATYLTKELSRWRDLDPDWLAALVFLAEDLSALPPDVRPLLREALLDVGAGLRDEEGNGPVVWSALRRAASLAGTEQSQTLLDYLDHRGAVDTRLVALQCIGRVFATSPEAQTGRFPFVADRVAEYARKYLDPDVFTAGETAAIAQAAVVVLATMGDERLSDLIARARALKKPWLTMQLHRKLADLVGSWNRQVVSTPHPALSLVQSQLAVLAG